MMTNIKTPDIENLDDFCKQIEEVTMPLKEYFNVSYFSANIFDKEEGLVTLSNNVEFFQAFQDQAINHELQHYILTTFPKTGIYLINYDKFNNTLSDKHKAIYQKFSISDAIVFLDIYLQEAEPRIIQYTFNLNKTHDSFNQNIMDNLDLIKEFSRYFVKRFSVAIKTVFQTTKTDVSFIDKNKFENFLKNSFEMKDSVRTQFAIWLYKNSMGNKLSAKLNLTKREEQVLKLTALERLTSKQIAERLNISKRTIDRHFENLRMKFGEYTKASLIDKVIKLNLLELNP